MSKPEAHCEVCGGPCVASGPLRREAAAARDKVSQLEAENAALKAELEESRAQCEAADNYSVKCKAETDDHWRECNRLKADIERMAANYNALAVMNAGFQGQLHRLRKAAEDLRSGASPTTGECYPPDLAALYVALGENE